MTPDLALKLLRLNARLRFGALATCRKVHVWSLLTHFLAERRSIPREITTALRDLSLLADEFDDRIVDEAGGKRMQDLIDAEAQAAFFSDLNVADPSSYS